ncbi:MAG: CHAD domain-containing protein [Vicinamibacteria bacterium]
MPSPSPADPAARLLHARLVRLLQTLPAAQAGDVTSVHQARVASRRLREALPVAGPSGAPVGRISIDGILRHGRSLA